RRTAASRQCAPLRSIGRAEHSCRRRAGGKLGLDARRFAIREQVHAAPGKVTNKLTQLRRHAFKIGIMAQPGFERRTCDARLARIDFPRMEIKHRRSLLEAVDLADSPAAETVRQHPKETAPARS